MNVKQIQEWLKEDIGERGYSFEDIAKLIKIEHKGKMINLFPVGVEVLWSEIWTFEQCLMVAEAFDIKLDIIVKVPCS